MIFKFMILFTALLVSSCSLANNKIPANAIWKKHVVQNPGSAVNTVVTADFDKDGVMDIMASFAGQVVLYKGPKWEKFAVMPKMPAYKNGRIAKRGCIHSTLMDVDGDGDLDYVGSNRMLFWLECPKNPFEDEWIPRVINHELNGAHCLITGDVDKDGRLDLIANSWRDKGSSTIPNSVAWLRAPKNPHQAKPWRPFVFANNDAPGRNHYMGFGDVNKDGRPDISCGAVASKDSGGSWFAWWEQPTDPEKSWEKHILSANEPGASNILHLDLDSDGHVDFLASRGHGKGVLWFKGPKFTKIDIDKNIDTPHSLAAADLDGDGDLDLVTCSSKRGGMTVWYENDGKANFTRHIMDKDQCSYDIRLVDLDGDGDLDVLIAGHYSNNIVWYENPLK